MAGELPRCLLEDGTLKVEVQKDSSLLAGVHRVFLVNVLGFEPSDDFTGYWIKGAASQPRLLTEVVHYLRQNSRLSRILMQEPKWKLNGRRIRPMISMRQGPRAKR